MEKAGFQLEGLLREKYVIHGRPSDALILGLLKREWEPIRHL
ncbi:GNAT family protein [Tumebacillus sp. DT12]|uniref:GNAT family protein n=1 Tax=Tumebacillus lacus TaxID=2995335 RepID=A0ABT3X5N2_9BACL|nr:GNAT family protein [Tumebacillus lacus]